MPEPTDAEVGAFMAKLMARSARVICVCMSCHTRLTAAEIERYKCPTCGGSNFGTRWLGEDET